MKAIYAIAVGENKNGINKENRIVKVREKETGRTGWGFRLHPCREVVVGFDDDDYTSVFAHDLEVFLESSQEWVSFGDKRIVTHNDTEFREARTQEEIDKGYYP